MRLDEELEQIRGTLQYMRDRQAILDCITRESRGRDRHDAEMTASCYWADGTDESKEDPSYHGPVRGSAAESRW